MMYGAVNITDDAKFLSSLEVEMLVAILQIGMVRKTSIEPTVLVDGKYPSRMPRRYSSNNSIDD